MTATTTTREPEALATPWWLVLIEGIALVVLGLLLLANPRMGTVTVAQVLGLYWLIGGIIKIVSIFIDHANWGWKLFAGILGILAGIIVIQHPLWSTIILARTTVILLGFAGILIGAVGIYQAFKGAGWGTGIMGAISLLLGLILLANSWLFTFSLPWTLGILSLVGGVVVLFGAFRLKSEQAEQIEAPAEPAAEAAAEQPGAETAAEVAVAAEVVDEATDEEPAAEPSLEAPEAATVTGSAAQTHDLSYVEGIGPAYSQALKEAGIESVQGLLDTGATPKGRSDLADKTGISGKLILEWVNHADLLRIRGVGSEYADLLEAAGVDTVPELAQRNPGNLYNKLVEVNEEKKLVRHVPSESQVDDWVAQAKELPRKISY